MSQAAFHRTQWFRLNDDKTSGSAMIEHNPRHTSYWNDEVRKHGIFWLVNKSKGGAKREDIVQVLSWAVDIDFGTKEEQLALIHKFLPPSFLVQTKNGYHVYYDALNGTIENFDLIMREHLVPNLLGDFKAANLNRVLRVPATYHWKDSNDPYFVSATSDGNYLYTEADIMAHFPKIERTSDKKILKAQLKRDMNFSGDSNLWQRVWELNCGDALNRLSGSHYVNNEHFDFRNNANGKQNIYVNGKGTSCFLDIEGHIGSSDGGGPTIFGWLKWYGHSNSQTVKILRDKFPELFK